MFHILTFTAHAILNDIPEKSSALSSETWTSFWWLRQLQQTLLSLNSSAFMNVSQCSYDVSGDLLSGEIALQPFCSLCNALCSFSAACGKAYLLVEKADICRSLFHILTWIACIVVLDIITVCLLLVPFCIRPQNSGMPAKSSWPKQNVTRSKRRAPFLAQHANAWVWQQILMKLAESRIPRAN